MQSTVLLKPNVFSKEYQHFYFLFPTQIVKPLSHRACVAVAFLERWEKSTNAQDRSINVSAIAMLITLWQRSWSFLPPEKFCAAQNFASVVNAKNYRSGNVHQR